MAYDDAGNELDSPAGEPVLGGSTAMRYSPRNLVDAQLLRTYDRCFEELGSACTQPDPAEDWQSNVYDGRGVRVISSRIVVAGTVGVEPPPTHVYFYTPELTMLNIVSHSTGRTADVIWFGSRPVADHDNGVVRYTYADHLGTPILQTTASGTVTWRAEYEPYGSVYTLRSGVAKDDQPLRLPGQQVSYGTTGGEESYNIFRWYRGGWGRYTQADPIGRRGDPHAYLYGAASPITTFDRYGLLAEVVCADITLFGLPWSPFRHCRIRVTCDQCEGGKFGGPYDTSIGLERNRKSPKKELDVTDAPVGGEYTYRYPINNVDQQDSCQFGRCVRALAASYDDDAAKWTPQYSIFGPNSNSFAGHVMRWCGGVGPPDGPFGATGFNQPLGFK